MDGVIIDSEPLWAKAEKEVFSSVGVNVSEELTQITKSMTTSEVTQFWYEKHPWQQKTLSQVEHEVVAYVEFLIKQEGATMAGLPELLKRIKEFGPKIGLATNSPNRLIPVVLEKLNIRKYFDAITSAEHEIKGKPDPSVYLTIAQKLGVAPKNCLVVEDSNTGLLAAKRAGMKTVAYTPTKTGQSENHKIADIEITHFDQFDFSFFN